MPPPRTEVPGSRRRGPVRALLGLLAFFAAGAVVGAGAAHFGSGLLPQVGLTGAIAFVIAMWPNVILHEAGHALAGLARGMQLVAFGIGPLRAERGNQDRWRLRHGGGVRGMSGFAAMAPRAGREPGRIDQALVLAGGPLANLLVAALCLWLGTLSAVASWVSQLAVGFGASALVLGLVNLLPLSSGGWRSDGRGLIDLVRGSPHAALQQQVNQMVALSMAGVRPRLWPAGLVPGASAEDSSPLLAAAADAMRLTHAMDMGDDAAAARAAEDVARQFWALPEAMRPAIAVGVAGYAARITRDAPQLRAWRAHCGGRSLLDLTPYLHWLDAELAMLEDQPGHARTEIASARATLGRVHDAAGALLMAEYLDGLESRLRQSAVAPAGAAIPA